MISSRIMDEIHRRFEADPEGEAVLGFTVDETISPTRVKAGGREIILAGANNYLGLNHNPQVVAAAAEATLENGTGTTASRLASGTHESHLRLEEEIGSFLGYPPVVTFSTGYQANLGVLSSLCEPGTVTLIDGESHASIIDGCRLGGGRFQRFAHNDASDLAHRLKTIGGRRKIVVVEGIYSMSGDVAPLADIAAVCEQHGALLVVDEAHALGVLGKTGRGAAQVHGVEDKVAVLTGTFSKSLGAVGGFAAARDVNMRDLRFAARSYVFSASLPPGIVAGVRKALELIATEPLHRRRLKENISALSARFAEIGLDPGHPDVPIFALPMISAPQAFAVWHKLIENGVYVNLVVPPASPSEKPILRLSVSAAHSADEIARIGDAVRDMLVVA
jgi:8-amino-7-oxononanoate synthase